jgi:inosine triphosphate pyrophosphatase
MENLTFITGNQFKADKLAEYLDIPIAHQKLDLDEIQSLDVTKIVEHKVRQAYDLLGKPVLVEDSALSFDALNGLPGPFIKFFVENIPMQDICNLLNNKSRKAHACAVIGYFDGHTMKIIKGGLDGEIALSPIGDGGWDWDKIFIPEGQTLTNAQLDETDYQTNYLKIKPIEKLKEFLLTIN